LKEVVVSDRKFPAIPPIECESRPFWSVVIPVYNRRQFLLECLASVLAQWQDETRMEIIVADNGSDPPLCDLVDSLGRGIVKYYRQPQHLLPQQNWNSALTICRGEWIHVLPGFYDRLQGSLQTCPSNVGAAFTGYENINENDRVLLRQQIYGNYRGIVRDWLWYIGVFNILNPPSVVIRRSTYEHLGGYSPEFFFTTDWELYKRIAVFYDWWCEPEILAHYREHSLNATSKSDRAGMRGKAIRRAIEISQSYLPENICQEIIPLSSD
jgi:protein O-GlcNAc transferase